MDVGIYIGELLLQRGEVSVPDLGHFVLDRVSSYYDEQEEKFYPPHHKTKFSLVAIDNDDLAGYIADKKNISVTSSKYFLEKYITGLKQAALAGEVAIGNLGWFYTEFGQLTFRPADKLFNDPVFYGFEPVKINKAAHVAQTENTETEQLLNNDPQEITEQKPEEIVDEQPQEAVIEQTEEIETELIQKEPVEEVKKENIQQDAVIEYENEEKSNRRTWLIILTIIIFLTVGALVVYMFYPPAFDKLMFWKHNTTVIETVKPAAKPRVDTIKTDTVKTDSPKTIKDTTAKIPVAKPAAVVPVDTIKTTRYEVVVAAYNDAIAADKAIKRFKNKGLDAKIVNDAPNKLFNISVGAYKTYAEAHKYCVYLINSGKITTDVYPLEIKPKK